ncbi:SusC/RagA family TonB-linked outer membrane protein, partial [Pedobacter sp. ASV12]|uniref:SusC/RagA family TonB-linked outer membrane protein n=1 Tax=Pedobacter sp. ASV12 TaxID=2795120 RepID=UPI0018EA4C07
FLQCSAKVFGQKISLNEINAPLKKVLKIITDQTGYVFFYESKDIQNKSITIKTKDLPFEAALAECFKNQQLDYEIVNKTIFIKKQLISVETPLATNAPQVEVKVTGQVYDEKNIAMPEVTVKLKDGTPLAITDKEGKFNITVPSSKSILVFSFIGYVSQELAIVKDSLMIVHMQLDQSKLNEVVVLGYGSVKQRDLTGSVSTISSAKITQAKGISNVAQTLQGQMAGVQVNQASGQPGEAMKIAIRGTNSITGSNAPLYVIDGQITQDISAQLNVDDIASIDVLKDASSTAIYGSRGANGVIMITTKKGTSKASGKPQISYDGYYGVANLRHKLKLIDATEYAQLQNEVTRNDNLSGLNNPAKPLPWTQSQISSLGSGTDWQDPVSYT